MFEIEGRHCKAVVFAESVEESAFSQILELCNEPFAEGSTIRIMPDVHAGSTCPIGTTMTIADKVVPHMVGVDIGCGLEVVKITERNVDFPLLDRAIRTQIPSGYSVREKVHMFTESISLNDLTCAKYVDIDRAYKSVGSLGGGNHFIEIAIGNSGDLYIVVHSGSRRLGLEVANHYQDLGKKPPGGRFPFLEGVLMDNYLHDMRIVQKFADINRKAMIDDILSGLNLHPKSSFSTVHNYIGDDRILRKGAISARVGEKVIIPLNMRDGSLIASGKGNPDWNFSAPHGAGRILSRGKAKRTLSLAEFEREMEGIFSTSVKESTLDESPMAYKSKEEIMEHIGDTVEVLDRIKPLYNFKA